MLILSHVTLISNRLAVSDWQTIPLSVFLETLPKDLGSRLTGCKRKSLIDDVVDPPPKRPANSWRESYVARTKLGSAKEPVHTPPTKSIDVPVKPFDELDDEGMQNLEDHLAADRADIDAQYGRRCADFHVTSRGGHDTFRRFGVVGDQIRAQAATNESIAWCLSYRLNQTFNCSRAKFEEAEFEALTVFWCQKMQYMYYLYIAAGGGSYVYGPDVLQDFVEPEELVSMLAEGPPQYFMHRVNQIRAITPR